jgi:hypothetical protein
VNKGNAIFYALNKWEYLERDRSTTLKDSVRAKINIKSIKMIINTDCSSCRSIDYAIPLVSGTRSKC